MKMTLKGVPRLLRWKGDAAFKFSRQDAKIFLPSLQAQLCDIGAASDGAVARQCRVVIQSIRQTTVG
jgi:hypothetical protein